MLRPKMQSRPEGNFGCEVAGGGESGGGKGEGTFDQFAPVHLARCDLKRYDMVLYAVISAYLENRGRGNLYLSFIQQLYGDPDGASHLED